MIAVYITFHRQRTLPKINEESTVQGQIYQIIHQFFLFWKGHGFMLNYVYSRVLRNR